MNRRVAWIIGGSLAIHLLLAALLPLSGDESYHWWWAMHPAFSYQEHPPLQAWLIRGCIALLGNHTFAVRLPAILGGVIAAWLLVKIMLRLSPAAGAAPAQPARFALLINLLPLYFVLFAYANNDMIFYAFALAALYGAWRCGGVAGDGGERWALWIGPLLALALLAKLIALLLLPAVIYALTRRPSRLPPRFWAGIVLGAVMMVPFLLWNQRYGWPVLGIRVGHNTVQYVILQFLRELLLPELLTVTPLFFIIAFGIILRGRRLAPDRRLWFLTALLILAPYHLMAVAQHVEFHWPFLGFLLLAPVIWVECAGWRRSLLITAAGCLALIFLFVTLTLGQFMAWRYPLRPTRFDSVHVAAQLIGWPELRQRLRAESQRMNAGGFLIAEGYGMLTQGLFLLDGNREGFLVENPVRSGGSIAYFEAEHPPVQGAQAVYFAEADSPSEPEIRRKLALLFDRLEPAEPLQVSRGETVRRFVIFRLSGFRGFAQRDHFYAPENYLHLPAAPPVAVAAPPALSAPKPLNKPQ